MNYTKTKKGHWEKDYVEHTSGLTSLSEISEE